MAGIREIAIGVATVLQCSAEPEPLPLDLRGQSVDDAIFLMKQVIDECADAGLALHEVRFDTNLWQASLATLGSEYRQVSLRPSEALGARIEFYRRSH